MRMARGARSRPENCLVRIELGGTGVVESKCGEVPAEYILASSDPL